MTSADLSYSASLEGRWWTFVTLLVGATLTPLVFFPFSVHFTQGAIGLVALSSLLTFLGGSVHVGATGFFYSDAEVREFFRRHRWRYYVIPLLLTLGSGLVFSLANVAATAYLIFAYFAWQTYHYQKQNYGILSFVAAATDRVRPSRLEQAILQLSVLIGIVGLVKPYSLGQHTLIEHFSNPIHEAAAYAFWIVPALLLAAFVLSPVLRCNITRMVCLALGGFFFLPTFLFDNPAAAISGYAVAHGLQYLVFMYFVGSARAKQDTGTTRSKQKSRVILLTVIALAIGGALALMGGQTPLGKPIQFIFGCYLGLVMSHFVIDAGIWKLRDPFARAYMGRAFEFVFARGRRSETAKQSTATGLCSPQTSQATESKVPTA